MACWSINKLYRFDKDKEFISRNVPGVIGDLNNDERSEYTFSLIYSGNIQVLVLQNWLYKDGNEFYLERKKYETELIKNHVCQNSACFVVQFVIQNLIG